MKSPLLQPLNVHLHPWPELARTRRVLSTLALLCCFGVTASYATNIVVTSSGDAGAGTLRAAITTLNASPGPHSITFDPSVSFVNITSNLPTITRQISVDGGGTVTVSVPAGDGGYTIFSIGTGGDGSTLKGMTLQNTGLIAIRLTANLSNLTIQDLLVKNNANNYIDDIIYADGSLTNTLIKNIDARNIQFGTFWGINIVGSTDGVTIDNFDISASGGGDMRGIQFQGAINNNVVIKNCTLNLAYSSNLALFDADEGNYGIYFNNAATNVTIDNVNIPTAEIYGIRTNTVTNFTISNCNIGNSRGWGVQIGIRFEGVANQVNISNTVVNQDHTTSNDNGDYGVHFNTNASDITVNNLTIHDSDIYAFSVGGALTGTNSISNSTFDSYNTFLVGTGNIVHFYSTVTGLTMTNVKVDCDVTGTTNDRDNGIAFIGTVANTTLNNVRVTEADDNGIYVWTAATNLAFNNCKLTNNGDGIEFYNCNYARTNVDITNTKIDNCSNIGVVLPSCLGGVNDDLDMINDTITNCGNVGIYIFNANAATDVSITQCIISGNGKITGGAGIDVSNADNVIITQNSIYNNTGLGINLTGNGNCNMEGTLAPVINSVTPLGGGQYQVSYTIPAGAGPGTFKAEFFTNNPVSGVEGEYYVHTVSGLATGTHTTTFTSNTGPAATPRTASLTMTYTRSGASCNGTSEFSNALALDPQGPGCVNSGILGWYRADKQNVSTNGELLPQLLDYSGSSNKFKQLVAGEQPAYFSGDVTTNFNPSFTFDGAGDNFEIAAGLLPTNTGGTVLASAFNTNTASTWADLYNQNIDDPVLHKTSGIQDIGLLDNGNVFYNEPTMKWVNNVTAIGGFDYGTTANTTHLYFNGRSSANLGGTASPEAGIAYIGGENTTESWTGKIHEMIFYNRSLTAAERQKINSYLSIRWGASIDTTIMKVAGTGNDYVTADGTVIWTANNTYYHRITGIGRDDCDGLIQKQSRNVNTTHPGYVTIGLGTIAANNPSNTNNFSADKSFLVWGDDGKSGTGSTTITGDGAITLAGGACAQYARLSKTFKVQETGTVGSVQLQFNMIGVKLGKTAADYYLAINSNSTFTGTITKLVPAASYDNVTGVLVFDNVDFTDGQFFTVIGKRVYGPANVTSNLKLWLKAEDGIAAANGSAIDIWADQGPAGNDMTQSTTANQPLYYNTSNLINYNPVVSFDGVDDYMRSGSNVFGTGNISYSAFGIVSHTSVSSFRYFFSDGVPAVTNQNVFFGHQNAFITQGSWNNDFAAGPIVAGVPYMEGFTRDAATATRTNYLSAKSVGSTTAGGAINKQNNGFAYIGATTNTANFLNGRVGEIITYQSLLPAADQQKINSYLSVKWGITLDQTTPYNYLSADGTVIWDATANATYKNRITGIGRDDCSDLIQRQSRNQDTTSAHAIIGLGTIAATNVANTGSFSADKSFLIWGDDNLAGTATTTVTGDGTINLNPSACGVFRRLAKTFKIVETGSGVGPVQVKINLRGITLAKSASDLYLAIHSSATFTGTVTKLVAASSLSGGVVTFDNVDFSGTQYFTVIGQKSQGPANLTSNLKLWLRADDGINLNGSTVSEWTDQGPAGNDAKQATVASQPTYNGATNLINFNPSLSFNGTSNQLKTTASVFGTGSLNYTVFGVANANSSATHRYLLTDGTAGCNSTVGFGLSPANYMANVNWCNDLTVAPAVTMGTTYLETFTRNGTTFERNNILNGLTIATSTVAGLNKVNGTGSTIGNAPTTAEYWNGRIGEIIAFETELNAADRLKVHSYLAVKWGLSLDQTTPTNYVSANGTVVYDATAYSSYRSRITGIGRDDCSDLLQKQSKNQDAGSLVTVSNGTTIATTNEANGSPFSADNSWMLFGDNNKGVTWTGSGVPINGGNVRLNRVWRVKETGTVGTVYIEVPDNSSTATTKLPSTINSIYLLVANSSTSGKFSALSGVTVKQMTFDATNKVWYTTYNFSDGDYFTFGSEKVCIAPVGISEGLTSWYHATDMTVGAIPVNTANALSDQAFGVYPLNRNSLGTATVVAGSATSFNYNRSITLTGNASFFKGSLTNTDALETNAGSMFAVGTTNANIFAISSTGSNSSGLGTNALFNGTTGTYGAGISGVPNIYGMIGSTTNVTGYTNGTAGIASGSIAARAAGAYTLGLGQNGSNGVYNNGSIAEGFTYNRVLDPEERLVLESYLAIKYGQTLSHNYYNADYDGTNASSTTLYDVSSYANRVFGIGTDTTGCFYQKQSTSALTGSMLKMTIHSSFAAENSGNTALFTQDRSYVMAGDDNGSISAWVTGGGANQNTPAIYANTCVIPTRINRQWKVKGTYTTPTTLFALPDAASSEATKLPSVPVGYSVWMVLNDNPDFGVNAFQQEVAMTLNPLTNNWEASYQVPAGATKYVTFVLKNNAIATGATAPSITITATDNSCAPDDNKVLSGAAVLLTPTPGVSYVWDNAATSSTRTVNPVITSTYSVTVTAANGCTGTATSTITIVTAPTAAIAETDNSCAVNDGKVLSGDPAVLTASGGTTYAWNDLTMTAMRTVNPLVNTTYTVTVSDANGCTASSTYAVSIVTKPIVTLTGVDEICVGAVTGVSPTSGGTWASSDNAIATVTNAGVVTGVSGGTADFIFTNSSNGCESDATPTVTVNALPVVNITGANSICIGTTTTLSPSSGGTWSSSDPMIATVTDAGVVTGVAVGSATFTFTNSTTGCVSMATAPVTVNALPVVSVTGPTTLCVGQTTNLSPIIGGTWVSSNPTIASVTNGGVVTALSDGSVFFTFTKNTSPNCSASTASITVNPLPIVSITGDNVICVGETTNLSPTTGGTWMSSNAAVATVNSGGVVAGVSGGTAMFTFTNTTTGCVSPSTPPVTVDALPVVSITGASSICAGFTTTLSPTTGGTWASSNPAVATVTNAGLVTGVAGGTTTLTFTDGTTGCVSMGLTVTVTNNPVVSISGNATICAGATTTLSPTSGGTWMSNNPSVATVTNAGVVTGVSAGTATFTFTSSTAPNCSSTTSAVTVDPLPVVNITGASTICVGATTTLSPTTGGTWVSNNPTVATVTDAGVVTAVSGGTATFTFTNGTTGCVSMPTSAVTVNPLPVATITGASSICIGNTTTLSPTTGGTWVSSNPAVATVTNAGVVTAVSAGTAMFTFTNSVTGCVSMPTSAVTVNPTPTVNYTGLTSICIGAMSGVSPTSGGTWSSSNAAVATIDNAGVITAVSAGTAAFTFTDGTTGCMSAPTSLLTVNPTPAVSITGPSSVCIGGTTTLSPTTGGTWMSNNPAVATVTSAGVVTGVSAGSATFIFTNSTTGCQSAVTSAVTVNGSPVVSITGASSICVGATTMLSPTSGGTWVSSDPAVATVTNAGVVTAVSAGTATFTFTNTTTGCVSAATSPVTVNALPVVAITGPTSICVGSTTGLSPTSGGNWVSNNPAVATVTNSGVVTGVSAGTATFTFTNTTTGCVSVATAPVTVYAIPTANITGSTNICIGFTTTLSPTTGGTWVSTNPAVATVTNSGIVTGVSAGSATFVFTNSTTGCVSVPTGSVTVAPTPTVSIIGPTNLCIGATTGLSPSSGGTWVSSNPAVATVTNAGVVTAVAAGTAIFTFTNTTTGCVSAPTPAITVNNTPAGSITGSTTICVGSTTTLSPTSGGTWASSNPAIATVTNAGVVTGISAGTAMFTFTNTTTGCISAPTPAVSVNALPVVSITGGSNICVGGTTTLSPTTGGVWASSNPAIATVTNGGLVTGVASGSVTFTFTNSVTGCVSASTLPVTVNPTPVVSITGATSICVGSTTGLSPTTGGTWVSNNPAVATVTSAGVVTGVAAGTATFTFTNTSTGCVSAATAPVTVNAIPVVSITGGSTICVGATTNLTPTSGGTWASSNPAVATVTNAGVVTGVSAGTVAFTFTNTTTGCVSMPTNSVTVGALPTASITGPTSICVGATTTLSPNTGGTWASSNPAIATVTNAGVVTGVSAGTVMFTFTNSLTGCSSAPTSAITVNAAPIVSITGVNSICIGSTTTLSPTSGGTWASNNLTIASVSNSGVVTALAAGSATFTFTSTATGCASAPTPIVTVNALPTVGISGASSICIGSTTTLSPASGGTWASNNPSVATVTNGGVVTAVAAGTATFTFTSSSTGCASAPTSAVTVTACNSLAAVKVLLGGPYNEGLDLMDDQLRSAVLIPNAQPYNGPEYSDFGYNGTETLGTGVLNVTGNDAIVDWVLIELRNPLSPTTVVSRKAALVQRDGDVVESTDGVSPLTFVGATAGSYYVAVRHRNHLGVMTATPVTLSGSTAVSVNFTSSATANYQVSGITGTAHAQRVLPNGKRALWEGNMSNNAGSGKYIQFQGANSDSDEPYYKVLLDPGNTLVIPNFVVTGYHRSDANLDGMVIYQGGDADADVPFYNVQLFPDNVLFLPNFLIFEQIP